MILHSKITPKRPQITPDHTKSVHLGHIFLLGLAKTVFLHCPLLHVSTHVEKKQAMCITSVHITIISIFTRLLCDTSRICCVFSWLTEKDLLTPQHQNTSGKDMMMVMMIL